MRRKPNVPPPRQTASPQRGTRHVSLSFPTPAPIADPRNTNSRPQATKSALHPMARRSPPCPASERTPASQSLAGVPHAPRPERRPPADESEAAARPHGARSGPRPRELGASILYPLLILDAPKILWPRQPLVPCFGKSMVRGPGHVRGEGFPTLAPRDPRGREGARAPGEVLICSAPPCPSDLGSSSPSRLVCGFSGFSPPLEEGLLRQDRPPDRHGAVEDAGISSASHWVSLSAAFLTFENFISALTGGARGLSVEVPGWGFAWRHPHAQIGYKVQD